jgi:negative regulator of sigma E activity
MKEKLNEQISALIDDELPEAEHALLIKRLADDASFRNRLARYQLISDSLQEHLPRKIDPDFNISVQLALQDEPDVQAGPVRLARVFKPVAGLAIAASVAVVAVLSLQSVRQENPSAADVVATAPLTDDSAAAGVASLRANNPAHASAGAQGLDIYLVNHNEYAVNRGMQGMLPYVRLVGQDMSVDDK